MNFFERILWFLSGTMPTPVSYGVFHLSFIAIALALTVFLCLRFRNANEKTVRIILMCGWGIITLFEIYKQLVFSIDFDPVKWDYQWYAFPFQFCSSPLYVLPIAALAPNKTVRNAARVFLATYGLFAGVAVFVYPNDVFISMIGINIQTMVHHGSQVVLGIFLAVILLRDHKPTFALFFSGAAIFACLVTVAFALNCTVPLFTDETFNMFYIGPKYPCSLVILSDIYQKVPYPVFLAIYTAGFTALAAIIFALEALVSLGVKKLRGRRAHAAG